MFTYTFYINTHDGNGLREMNAKPFTGFSTLEILNEELDSGYFEILTNGETPIPIFSYFIIDIVDDNSNNLQVAFYVSHDKVEIKNKRSKTFMHHISIIEPTKKFEKYNCGTVCFTQPSDLSQTKYYTSIKQCLERFIRIEPIGEDDTSVTWSYGDNYEDLPMPTHRMVDNVDAIVDDITPPQFFLQDLTFRQCCDAMLKPINYLSRYNPTYSFNGEYQYSQLQYVSYNHLNNQINLLRDVKNEGLTDEMEIDSYSTQIQSFVDNIVNENEKVTPIVEPSGDAFDILRSENEYEVNDSNCGILTNYPIYFINSVKMPFHIYVLNLAEDIQLEKDIVIDITNRIVEQEVYNNLPLKVNNNSLELTKDSTFSYTRGGMFISCSRNYKKIVFTIPTLLNVINRALYDNIVSNPTEYLGSYTGAFDIRINDMFTTGKNNRISSLKGSYDGTNVNFGTAEVVASNYQWDNIRYRINYTSQYDSKLAFERNDKSILNIKSANGINQQQRIVSLANYGNNLYSLAQREGVPTRNITIRHFGLNELLYVSDFTTDYEIITQAEYIYYKDFILGKYTLSKDYNRLSEFIGIDNEIRQFEIPSGNTSYERKINLQNYVEIGNSKITNKPQSWLTNIGKELLIDVFRSASSSFRLTSCIYTTDELELRLEWLSIKGSGSGTIDNPTNGLMLPVNVNGAGNSIIMQFGFNNNITFSSALETQDGKIFTRPIPYAIPKGTYKGFLRNCKLKLVSDDFLSGYSGVSAYKFPIVEYGSNSNPFIAEVLSLLILKDPSEILKFTYQINIISNDENIIVGRAFTEKNRFLDPNSTKPVVYSKSGYISQFNNIKTDGDVESGYSYIIAPNGNYYELNVYDNNSVAFSPTNKPSKNIILADPNTQDVFLIIKKEYFDNNSTIHFSFLKERSNVILDY